MRLDQRYLLLDWRMIHDCTQGLMQVCQTVKWPGMPCLSDNPWWPFKERAESHDKALLVKRIDLLKRHLFWHDTCSLLRASLTTCYLAISRKNPLEALTNTSNRARVGRLLIFIKRKSVFRYFKYNHYFRGCQDCFSDIHS